MTPDLAKAIGANIRAARNAVGWSQARLGAALGVTDEAVGNWEHGRSLVHPDGLVSLAVVLGVGVEQLAGTGGEA